MMSDKRISTFEELHRALESFKTTGGRWLFRGHGSSSWKLVPKAGRIEWPRGSDDLGWFGAWKRRAIEYISSTPETDWDWLAIAQHHGLATRLLDWSMNPLAAAFFALECDTGKDAALFAFLPPGSVDVTRVEIPEVTGVKFVRPRGGAQRISRQAAVFTIHSPPTTDLTATHGNQRLSKLVLAHEARKRLLQDLDYYGVNRLTLFPDLDGISQYLNWYIENGFNVSAASEAGTA